MAAYANVPTKPTNSSKALNERFIFFLLRVDRDSRETVSPCRRWIIHTVRP